MRSAIRLRTALLAVLLCLLPVPGTRAAAQAPPLWGELRPGPHAVGFRVEWIRDPARAWGDSAAPRPIQVSLWYPAAASPAAAPLRLRDDAHLLGAPEGRPLRTAAERSAAERRALAFPGPPGTPGARYDTLMALETLARHGAPAADGRFPVVVLGMGWTYESPLAQVVLAEYLASLGYRVASAPLVGTRSPLAAVGAADLETQVRDLEQVLAWAKAQPRADAGRTALVGFDLGGMAVALLAMRRPETGAVVSLDSGILSDRLMRDLMRPSPFYRLDRLRMPLLHATRTREENLARGLGEDRAVLDSAAGPRWLLRVRGMRHADFAIHGMVEGVLPAFWGPVQGRPDRGHAATLRLVGRFLDAHLRGDADARAFLRRDPAEWAPAGTSLTLERTGPSASAPGADEVAYAVLARGAAAAEPVYRAALAGSAGRPVLDEAAFRALGYELLWRRGDAEGAARVFGWAAEALPRSAPLRVDLGDALLARGDRAGARAAFRRAAELDPENAEAKARLAEMGAR
jgi:hypothetical protein